MFLSNLAPGLVSSFTSDASDEPTPAVTHLLWYCDGLVGFFLVSWVCTTLLHVDNDFYYAVFIWSALTFLYKYVQLTNTDVIGAVVTRWRSSLFFGALATIYLVANVWHHSPTAHPEGVELAFELIWRGLAYGSVSALVLTGFPMAVAYGVVGGRVGGRVRRIGFAALTLALIWAMSLTYHRGFQQFEDDPVTPQLISTSVSLPAVLTANPIGSIAAHTAFNIAATYRTFESDVLVPPAVEFVPAYEPPGVFGPR